MNSTTGKMINEASAMSLFYFSSHLEISRKRQMSFLSGIFVWNHDLPSLTICQSWTEDTGKEESKKKGIIEQEDCFYFCPRPLATLLGFQLSGCTGYFKGYEYRFSVLILGSASQNRFVTDSDRQCSKPTTVLR